MRQKQYILSYDIAPYERVLAHPQLAEARGISPRLTCTQATQERGAGLKT